MSKNILITGAGGSVGLLLTRFYLSNNFRVYAIDRSENAIAKLLDIQVEHKKGKNLFVEFKDILDIRFLKSFLKDTKIDYIIHCAALKHVSVASVFPDRVLDENVSTFKNIVKAIKQNHTIRKVIVCSSDKAAQPSSSMGKSKKIIEDLSSNLNINNIQFVNVRFGNILYSNGSILHKLEEYINENIPFFVRDKKMTRYILTKKDVIKLIDYALKKGSHGDIISIKVPAIKVTDLVNRYLKMRKKSITILFKKSKFKESIHESLFNKQEVGNICFKDGFFVYNRNQKGNLSVDEKEYIISSLNALKPDAYKKIYE